jgi:hypothetical protein
VLNDASAEYVARDARLLIPLLRFQEAQQQLELSKLNFQLMQQRARGVDTYDTEKQILDLQRVSLPRDYGETAGEQVASDIATGLASEAEIYKTAAPAAAVAGVVAGVGAGLLTRNPEGGLAVGRRVALRVGSAAGKIGLAASTFQLETGDAYSTFSKAKTDEGQQLTNAEATGGAVIYGLLATAVEMASEREKFRAMGPLGHALLEGDEAAAKREFLRNMANDDFKSLVLRAAKSQAQVMAAEGGEEGVQDATQQAIDYFTRSVAAGGFQKATTETGAIDVEQSRRALEVGALGALGPGAFSSAVNVASTQVMLDRARKNGALVAQLAGMKDSPASKAAPDDVAKMIGDATAKDGQPVTHLYIDAPAFVRYFQSDKTLSPTTDAAAAAEQVLGPGGADKLRDALATGSRVEITVARYLEHVGGTDLGQQLAADTATHPTDPTTRQLEEGAPEKVMADAKKIAAEWEKNNTVPDPALTGFVDTIEQQLVDTGRATPDEAHSATTLWRALARRMSEVFGLSEAQVFKDMAFQVVSAESTQQQLGTTSDILTNIANTLTPAQRATALFIDKNTGLLNEKAFNEAPAPAGKPLVGHVSVEGIKFLNDTTSHDKADLLYRAVARSLHAIDPTAAKVGSDFAVRVADQAELDRITQQVQASLPVAGFAVTGRVGETFKAAGDAHKAFTAAEVAAGRRANPRPLDANEEPLPPQKPFGFMGEPQTLALPQERAAAAVPEQLLSRVSKLAPKDFFNEAFLSPQGALTAAGWESIPRKAHVAILDMRGLRAANDVFKDDGKTGDLMLATLEFAAVFHGGPAFDFAHLHGDEFAAQSDNADELEVFLRLLDLRLDRDPILVDDPESGAESELRVHFRYGIGERNLESADHDLNRKRAEEKSLARAGSSAGEDLGQAVSKPALDLRRRERAGSEGDAGGTGSGDQGAHGKGRLAAELKKSLAHMRPNNRAAAESFIAYVDGKSEKRPAISPRLERLLGRYGVVDPHGFPFEESGRDMRRPIAGARTAGEAQSEDLVRYKFYGATKAEVAKIARSTKRRLYQFPTGEQSLRRLQEEAVLRDLLIEQGAKAIDPVDVGYALTQAQRRIFPIARAPEFGTDRRVVAAESANQQSGGSGSAWAGADEAQFNSVRTLSAPRLTFDRATGDYAQTEEARVPAPSDSPERAPLESLGNSTSRFFQPDGTFGARGYTDIQRDGVRRMYRIALTPTANRSTFVHESAHVFLEVFGDLAERLDAPQAFKDDYAKALKWLGVKSRSEIKEPQHEKWARGFEAYLFEGKTPAKGLAPVFARFKLWLRSVYRTIASLDVELSPDIRGVFDRLLASDDERQKVQEQAGLRPLGAQVLANLSPEEMQKYLQEQEEATAHATLEADHALMKDLKRVTDRWWKDDLAVHRDQALLDYERLPARVAQQALRGKTQAFPVPIRLNRGAVAAVVGTVDAKKLLTSADGALPDEVAAALGYPTGAALLQAVQSLPEKAAWSKAEAVRRMNALHPDIAQDRERLHDVVAKGVHGDRTAQWLLREWDALRTAAVRGAAVEGNLLALPGRPPLQAIKLAARDIAERTTAGRINHGAALQAERRAADACARAAARGDFEQALVLKERQLLQMYVYRELLEARDDREAFLDRAQRLASDTARARLGKARPVYRDAIDMVLELEQLKPPTFHENGFVSVGEVIAQMQNDGATVLFDATRLAAVLQQKGGWRQLSVADMRLVDSALKNIQAAARGFATVLVDGKRVEKDAVIAELQAEAQRNRGPQPELPSSPEAANWKQRVTGFVNAFDGSLLKPEQMLRWLGGGDVKSTWFRALVKPLQVAKAREVDLLRETIKPIIDAWEKVPAAVRSRSDETIDGRALFPAHRVSLDQDLAPPSRRFELLLMALNSGNESNLERLLAGRGITEDQLTKALATLSKEEWDWVQSVWDAAESLWPEAAALEERVSGLRPEKIQLRPVPTPFGKYKGGYFPAVYDRRVEAAGERAEARAIADLLDPSFTRPATAHGHLKGRVEGFSGAISLSPGSIYRHLSQVAHDIAYREALISVGSLVLDPSIQATLKERLGPGRATVFLQWLKDIGQMRGMDGVNNGGVFFRAARALRGNTTVAVLGYSLPNAVEDLSTNLLSAMTIANGAKPHRLAAALMEMIAHPVDTPTEALTRSGELRARRNQVQRELVTQVSSLARSRGPLAFVKEHAFVFSEAVDRLTSTALWLAKYREQLAAGVPEEQAVDEADVLLRRVLPSHSAVDLPAVLRDKGFVGSTMMFYGYFNVLYNQYRDTLQPLLDAEGLSGKAAALPTVGGRLLALLFVSSIISSLVRGQGKEPGEDWEQWFLRKSMAGLLSTVPFGGDVSQAIERVWLHKDPNPRTVSMVAVPISIGQAVADLPNEDKEASRRVVEMLRALGPLTGVPTSQPIRTGRYLFDVGAGNQTPTGPIDAAGGAIFGHTDTSPWNPLSSER